MKLFAFATALFLSANVSLCSSQGLPTDPETKLVSYTGVVDVPGTPKDSLYNKAMAWFKSYYKNPTDVIKEQDKEKGVITGIHRYMLTKEVPGAKKNDPPIQNQSGMASYTVKVMLKDNKFKYEITKINWKQQSYYPIERWMDRTSASYDPIFETYLAQTDVFMKKLVEDMKAGITKKTEKKNTDW